jgi:hypothetical protein
MALCAVKTSSRRRAPAESAESARSEQYKQYNTTSTHLVATVSCVHVLQAPEDRRQP